MNQSNAFVLPLATIVTTYLMRVLRVDSMMYGVIFGLCQQVLTDHERILQWEPSVRIVLLVLALLIAVGAYRYGDRVLDRVGWWRRGEYLELNIYNDADIETVVDYMKNFPDFYSSPAKMDFGNPELITTMMLDRDQRYNGEVNNRATYRRARTGTPIRFVDLNFGARGQIIWGNHSTEVGPAQNKTTTNLPYLQLLLDAPTVVDIKTYFNGMIEKNSEISLLKSEISLYHCKVIRSAGKLITNSLRMYNGAKQQPADLEAKYMATFFHPERDRLWHMVRQIHLHPEEFHALGQAPRIGLLLHGPPGTGKSTFAYRVAMCLNRHIVSVDLRSVKTRADVFQILRRPCINDRDRDPKEVVYIFDEFDLTVTELYHKGRGMDVAIEQWEKAVTRRDLMEMRQEPSDSKSDKKNPSVDNLYSMERYGYDHENINLGDLLELFQGPVPTDGMIVIATTNKYAEIKEMCPALFRHGRLTPVYFGYADAPTIQEISQFFFQETVAISDKYLPTLSTAHLLEVVVDAKMDPKKGFDYFRRQLKSLLGS